MIDDFNIKFVETSADEISLHSTIILYNAIDYTVKLLIKKYKSIRKLKEHDPHCCLQPSFSFFFLIFLSNDADFFDVELCMGMYGGMGISVSNTDVCRGDTCL